MKKMILVTACSVVSGSVFADSFESKTEQRINALEMEINRLKQELVQQKLTQQQIVEQALKQQKINTPIIETQSINAQSTNTKNVQTQQASAVQPVAQSGASTNTVKDKAASFWQDNVDVYGIIRMDATVDFKAAPDARGRTTSKINAIPFDAVHRTRSDVSIAATRFGVDVKQINGDPDLKAKLEFDFWANNGKGNGALRVRQAYVENKDWLLGQTWSLMSNMETATESVDFTQILGVSSARFPQVRYQWQIAPEHKLYVAAEHVGERSSAIPALTTKYIFKQDQWLALFQGFVNQKEALVKTDDIKKLSWGLGAGFKYKFNPQQSIQANYFHIVGDQQFVYYATQGSSSEGDLWGGDFSVNTAKDQILMNTYNTYTIGYSHRFNQQWRANLAASLFSYDSNTDYAQANPQSNRRLEDYVINAFYTTADKIELGIEYHFGQRENFERKKADLSRINLVSLYRF